MDDQAYIVADLVIDPVSGRVSRGHEEIALPKLSYELLLTLTREAPRLLSVEELTEKVWRGLVVGPETVSQRVKLLRDALGDDPKAPRYIWGVRGRGYQIKAPVMATPSVAATEQPMPGDVLGTPEFGSVPASRWQPSHSAAIVVAVVAICVGLAAYFFRPARDREVVVTGDTRQAAMPLFNPAKHSVAVLAFANSSGDPNQEYFSDGLAEEVLDALVRTNRIRVAARTSSFSFKGSSADIPTIARKLNVAAVLEGSVRKSRDRIRVSAQLVDGDTGFQLWSQSFDRNPNDVLAIETDIAAAVAQSMQVTLLGKEKAKLNDGGTSNAKAFDLYLRAKAETLDTEASIRRAIATYTEAIGLDPDYALAYASRGYLLGLLANDWVGGQAQRTKLNTEALADVDKAVELAPQSGRAYGYRSLVLGNTGTNYREIYATVRKAIDCDPGDAKVLQVYAEAAGQFGLADALDAANRALALNPVDGDSYRIQGEVLFNLRRYEEAGESFTRAFAIDKDVKSRFWLGMSELAAGRNDIAASNCETNTQSWYNQACLAIAYHRLGRHKDALEMLNKMKAAQGDYLAAQYADIYAQWGESELALRWLQKAVDLRDSGLIEIKVNPFLDPVRATPQFQRIVAQLNFP